MNKIFYIYKHTNKINNKVYIGQTCQDPEKRWRKGEGYKDSPLFYKAIQKYGWDNFTHEIIEQGNDELWADSREIYWIAYYDSYNNDAKGYNLTPGGSNYMKELWQNPEYREHMSKSFSEARKKSWTNEEFANNMLNKMLDGLKKSWSNPEWRAKRIQALAGENNPNAKAVINIETGKIFSTMKEAAVWAGLNTTSGICSCCKKKANTSGKHPILGIPLHWKYVNDNSSSEEILIQTQHKKKNPVRCINNNKTFESFSAAARWCGLKDSGKSIKACCIGKQFTAGNSPDTGERLRWSLEEVRNQ